MPAFNTQYVWIGASGGDWSDNVHNWTPGYPAASPPSYGDLAIFNNGVAEAVAGSGAASEADVVLGTTLTIMDSLSLDGAVSGVGLMVDSGGKVIVGNGATKPGVPSPGDVSVDVIGFMGAGALDVAAGGGLDDTGMVLGDRSTGSGTLTVEGTVIVAPAAAPNGLLIVGNAGSGVVTVQNGGALSAVAGTVLGLQSGSNGTATLTGAGSTWLAGALTVGSAGTGSITVADGGVLTTTGASFIGFDDAASGVHGTGSVTIEAGGTLNALTSLGIGSHGTLTVNGTGSLSGDVFVNGLFDISGSDGVSVSALAGTGHVTLGNQTLNVTGGSAFPFSGVMLGTGGLTKSGPGTLTLTGANTYTGVTHVTGGSLAISGAATHSKSLHVIVESGATLAGSLTLGAAANTFIDRGHFTGIGHMGLGNDHFTGGGNNGVRIFGDGGNDVLSGGAFNDLFDGGANNDILIGGGGADTLIGGVGLDHLTGGAAADIFKYIAPTDSPRGGTRDLILDFNRAQHDRIDLRGIDADTSANPGNDVFKFIGTQAFHGGGGELRCSAHIIQGDINGDKVADFEIHVNLATMLAGDFFL